MHDIIGDIQKTAGRQYPQRFLDKDGNERPTFARGGGGRVIVPLDRLPWWMIKRAKRFQTKRGPLRFCRATPITTPFLLATTGSAAHPNP